MGLDMYINKNKTTSYDRETRKRTVEISEVLYLRKANQIHKYIVDNLGNGIDECQEIAMDIEDIKELNEICKRIVKESELKEGWDYYNYSCSKWVGKTDELELAKKDGDKFVSIGKCSATMLNVGDYIYDNDHRAEKIESIEERDDRYLLQCGCEYRAKVITNPELAKELLPTQDGFFFGDTNYNEEYIADLNRYIKQADEIITNYNTEIKNGTDPLDLDYTYQASW